MDLHNLDEELLETIPSSHIFSNEETDDDDEMPQLVSVSSDDSNEDDDDIGIMKKMFGVADDGPVHTTATVTNQNSNLTWETVRARQEALHRARALDTHTTQSFDMNLYLGSDSSYDKYDKYNEYPYGYAGMKGREDFRNTNQVTYYGSKPKGLFNFGNTCFLNVILQVLLSLDNFQQFINSDLSRQLMLEKQSKATTDKATAINNVNNSVTYQLKNLFNQLLDTDNKMSIRPTDLRKKLATSNEIFADDAQQDVAEALCVLLDLIHNEHSQDVSNDIDETDDLKIACKGFWAKDHSPIVDLFYSMCQEKKSCNQCSHMINSYCPYAYIHLDVPLVSDDHNVDYAEHLMLKAKNPSIKLSDKEIAKMVGCLSKKTKRKLDLLDRNRREKTQQFGIEECIKNYFKSSLIEDAICGGCQARGYKSKLKLNIVPKIFSMQIKRFNGTDKKFNPIELRENIQLAINGMRHEYKISAVINHSGLNIQSGHYYMYGRNRTYNKLTTDKWFQFNDGYVSASKFEDITLSDVYMIFYELDCSEQGI